MDRAVTVVVNPAAGRGRTIKLLPRLAEALAASALDHALVLSTSPDDPVRIATEAFERGRVVVACGGDGLVGQLAGVAADAEGMLGVIPTGSGNDFARNLDFDIKEPLAAIDVLVAGTERVVDLGRVDGRWFCCVASTGFDAAANAWANTVNRLHGTPLYIAAMVRTLGTYRPRRFRVTVDGEVHELEAWLVAVGNAQSYGGGMRVTPHASLDDGLLDLTVVGPVSRAEFLRTFPKVFQGRHIEHSEVSTFRGERVEIGDLSGSPLDVYADGERAASLPAEITVVPKGLRLIAP